MELKIEYLPVGQLKPYEKNTRKHEEHDVDEIAKSIKKYGFSDPIGVWGDKNIIVEGHGRLLAAKKIGMETVPVIHLDHLSDEERREYAIMHNRTAELSSWDFGLLEEELLDLDLEDFDFDLEELNVSAADFNEQEIVEDEAPEEVETRCKLGDVWQLGTHRLICGNSTNPAVIDRLMDGVKADMVMTDAPYGVSAVNSEGIVIGYGEKHLAERGKYTPIIGDDTTETAQQAYGILSKICNKLILWGGNYFLDFLPASDGWLIWDKRGESGIRNNFADGEMAWCSFHTPVRIYHQLWNGMIREGEHEKRVHPTQKPVRMLSEILQDFTNEGDIILDVFGGSGSTLIACEQTGRTCYMAELSPEYVDVIIQRWEDYTGKKAVLLND